MVLCHGDRFDCHLRSVGCSTGCEPSSQSVPEVCKQIRRDRTATGTDRTGVGTGGRRERDRLATTGAAAYSIATIIALFVFQGFSIDAFYMQGSLNPMAVITKVTEAIVAIGAVYLYTTES